MEPGGKKEMRTEKESGSNYVAVFYDTRILAFVLRQRTFERFSQSFVVLHILICAM